MLSKFLNLTIVKKILYIYIINIFIFLLYIIVSYSFTENSIAKLKTTVKQQLPISQIYNNNYEFLDDIIIIFTDAVLTNEIDLLLNAEKKRDLILNNLKKISTHDKTINIEKERELFLNYFEYANNFTKTLLAKNDEKQNLKDMLKLQKISNTTITYFQKRKESSAKVLVQSLEIISLQTSKYFTIALFLAVIGLIFMSASIVTMYQMLKSRFDKIISSMKNLALVKPDFSKRLEIEYKDEIGEVVYWFNKLNSKLEIDYNHLNELKKETEQSLEKEIEDTQKEVIFTMGAIGETRSKETGNHVRRVAEYSKTFALHLGFDIKDAELLKQASPMHDIGKVAIPDNILNKPGKHTKEEFEIMKTHAVHGYEMLKHSSRPLLQVAAAIAHEHHEKWDGTGYPQALKKEEISIYARITAIADVFDALGSDRIYKKAWDDEKIFAFFEEEKGKHFDPHLVEIFFNNIHEFLAIREKFKDVF